MLIRSSSVIWTLCIAIFYTKATDPPRCDPCYSLVKKAVEEHNTMLVTLSQLLDRISNGDALDDNGDFEKRLSELKSSVEQLHRKCETVSSDRSSLVDQLTDLQERTRDVGRLSGTLFHYLQKATNYSDSGQRHTDQAMAIINGLDKALQSTQQFLETDGANALRRAISQTQHLGVQSEKMAEIARKSRHYAAIHHTQANEIADTMAYAIGNATLAYKIALQMLEHQENYTATVHQVDSAMSGAELELSQTAQLASQSQQQAREAYEKALSAFTEARASVTHIDISSIKLTATELKAESNRISTELELMEKTYGPLLNGLDSDLISTTKLLERLVFLQNYLDEITSECQNAKDKALSAVNAGERTLQEARRTLTTLQAFDRQVQQSRDQAGQSLQRVQEISSLVSRAEQLSDTARLQLVAADDAARAANRASANANSTILQVMKLLEAIFRDLTTEKFRLESFTNHSVEIESLVRVIEEETTLYEKQVLEDAALAQETLQIADRAKASAEQVAQAARESLRLCRQLTTAVEAAGTLDSAEVDSLQQRLQTLERILTESEVTAIIEEMRSFRSFQNRMARSYEEDLLYLRQEVSTIQEISEVLPETCYSQVHYE